MIRQRGPIPRVRSERFGGGSKGSKFSGFVALNTTGAEALIDAVSTDFLETVLAEEVGEPVITIAKSNAPVRTGELRDSGTYQTYTEGETAKIDYGFTANHAGPVEYGGGGYRGSVAPRPFLRPAHDEIVGNGKAKQRIAERIKEKARASNI